MKRAEVKMMGVTGMPAGLALWRGRAHLANAAATGDCCFRGLPRGLQSLKAVGKEWAGYGLKKS